MIADHQWNRLVDAMGRPAWTEPYSALDVRRVPDEIQDAVATWTRTRSKFDCESVLQAHGVAACAVRTLPEVVSNEHFLQRDFLRTSDDGRLSCSTFPALATPLPASPALIDPSSRTLPGLRIAEITNALAGPLAGATLGAMGATSVRFEEPQRPDLVRRIGPFHSRGARVGASRLLSDRQLQQAKRQPTGGHRPGVLDSGQHLGRPRTRERRWALSRASRPRAAGRRREDADLHERFRPDRSPSRVQGVCHPGASVRRDGRRRRELSDPDAVVGAAITDCNTALWAATLAAAWWLGGAEPYLFDLSMAEVVASNLNGSPLDVSTSPPPAVAPDLIIRCSDGSVAVATGSRPYGDALSTLGLDEGEAPIRRTYGEAVADVTKMSRTVEDVLQEVGEAGLSAYRSLGTAEVVRDAQLEGRGFIVRLGPPAVGISPIFALPWKVAGGGPRSTRTAGTIAPRCSARTTTGSTSGFLPWRRAASEPIGGLRRLRPPRGRRPIREVVDPRRHGYGHRHQERRDTAGGVGRSILGPGPHFWHVPVRRGRGQRGVPPLEQHVRVA